MHLDADVVATAALSLPERVVAFWPGPVGNRLRRAFWKRRLGAMGDGCQFGVGVVIGSPDKVFLGDRVWIDNYVHLLAGAPAAGRSMRVKPNPSFRNEVGEIHVGSNTHIAPFCVIQGHGGISIGRDTGVAAHSMLYSLSHHHRAPGVGEEFDGDYAHAMKFSPMSLETEQAFVASPVVMEDATALGLGSIMLPGSTLGRYSWIGVHSVVREPVPPGVIASGDPLQILKQRFGKPL